MHLNLLVPAADLERSPLCIGGQCWKLETHDMQHGEVLKYTCISYSWGRGRVADPFAVSHNVSDHTVPAITALVANIPACKSVWVDAFCVPLEEPQRAETLESMGMIYSRASQVVVVLSARAAPALLRMSQSDRITEDDLRLLESEDWVSRAWTYQETVNAKKLFFAGERLDSTVVSADRFLDCIGFSLSRSKSDGLKLRTLFPRLDGFEDVLVDYLISGPGERSALRVMSGMDLRKQERPADHFWAMIGAISEVRTNDYQGLEPCEAFMRACEQKGDFSFIFSAADREQIRGKRWRPVVSTMLPSILPWSSSGTSQPGDMAEDGLRLHDVVQLRVQRLDSGAQRWVRQWLDACGRGSQLAETALSVVAFQALQHMGFTGSVEPVETMRGYFFPYKEVHRDAVHSVAVSGVLAWACGAPAMAIHNQPGEGDQRSMPGVFVGSIRGTERMSVLLR